MDVKFCLKYLIVDFIRFIFVGQLTNGVQGTCSTCTRFEMRKDLSCREFLTTVRNTDMTTCMRHCTDDCQGLSYNELERTCTLCSSVIFSTNIPGKNALAYEKVCPLRKSIGYVGYTLKRSWEEAREFCEKNHKGLAVINNDAEYESLKTALLEAGMREDIWIGGRLVSDQWEWVTKGGPNIKMTWFKLHPNAPYRGENLKCLDLWDNYQFNNDDCNVRENFACKL